MECYHLKRGGIGLSGIPMVLGHLLQNCPSIGVNSEKAEARLYPSPSADPFEDHLRDDWKTVVEPDLQEHFRSARSVMEADVRNMRIEEESCTVEIPTAHIDPWISALNQARLSLAAEHDFSERELSGIGPIDIRSDRDLALVQINFFAVIQDLLISEASA